MYIFFHNYKYVNIVIVKSIQITLTLNHLKFIFVIGLCI